MPARGQTSQYHVDVTSPPPAGVYLLNFNPSNWLGIAQNNPAYVGEVIPIPWYLELDGAYQSTGTITIELDRGDGSGWVELASVDNADYQQYAWNWTVTAPVSSTCTMRLTHVESGAQATSPMFAIASVVTPTLRFTNPVAGSSWKIGTVLPIRWDDAYAAEVFLRLYRDDGSYQSFAPVLNTGSYNWTVSGLPQTNAYFTIQTLSGTVESGRFAIFGDTVEPPPDPTPDELPDTLLEELDKRLGNTVQWGSMTRSCDGLTRHFYVDEKYVRELSDGDPDRLRVYLYDGDDWVEQESGWSFSYDDSWLHFDAAPARGQQLRLDYSYQRISHGILSTFVRNSFDYLFPAFYSIVTSIVPVKSEGEYLISQGTRSPAAVIDVWTGDGENWPYRLTPSRDYRVARLADRQCLLTVFGPVTEAMLRVNAAYRPQGFTLAQPTLASLGLPDEMRECIVLYVIWQVHAQGLSQRMDYDQVVAAGSAMPTVRDLTTTTQMRKLLLDMEVENRKMRPWTARGI